MPKCNRCDRENPPEIHTCFATREYLCSKEDECEEFADMLRKLCEKCENKEVIGCYFEDLTPEIQKWWEQNK